MGLLVFFPDSHVCALTLAISFPRHPTWSVGEGQTGYQVTSIGFRFHVATWDDGAQSEDLSSWLLWVGKVHQLREKVFFLPTVNTGGREEVPSPKLGKCLTVKCQQAGDPTSYWHDGRVTNVKVAEILLDLRFRPQNAWWQDACPWDGFKNGKGQGVPVVFVTLPLPPDA
ncbi:hypothetical protein BJV78DRAFT_1153176 [Lactifluus subvellereus]|nr:hypothetical protein BJV78DRAFT_1153176 [Lactifluus subvellereus]